MSKIKEDALKEPRKVSGNGSRDIRSNYFFCPTLCRSCVYFEETESNWPYKCCQGTSDNIASRSKQEGYRQYDDCKYFKEKEKGASIAANNTHQTISLDENTIFKKNHREIEQEEEEWKQQRTEQLRQEQEKTSKERERKTEEQRKYDETHCCFYKETGNLTHIMTKYFHQECWNKFILTDDGEKWLANEEKENIEATVYYISIMDEKEKIEYLQSDSYKKWEKQDYVKKWRAEQDRKLEEKELKEKEEAEGQAGIEAEKKEQELQTKKTDRIEKRLQRKVRLPVFIAGSIITLFFRDTLVLALNKIQEGKFIPVIALFVILAIYNGMLKLFVNSVYDTINTEIQKGYKATKFNNFIAYAGTVLITTAIHGGIVFLVIHKLVKLW